MYIKFDRAIAVRLNTINPYRAMRYDIEQEDDHVSKG